MDILQIEKLLSALASAKGYSAIIVSESNAEKSIEAMPAAMIYLPKVLWVEGRDEGLIGYQVNLSFADDCRAYSFSDQCDRLKQMEQDMIEVMTDITLQEGIVEVSKMSVTPRTYPTTRHDNVAVVCQATLVAYF